MVYSQSPEMAVHKKFPTSPSEGWHQMDAAAR
jgi:hypothetical protein